MWCAQTTLEFFLNRAELSARFSEFRESENHWSMNWAHIIKIPVSHMCLAGAVIASWSLTQEMTGSSHFTVMTNIFTGTAREGNVFTCCVCHSVQESALWPALGHCSSLLIYSVTVTARSVRILLEYFLVITEFSKFSETFRKNSNIGTSKNLFTCRGFYSASCGSTGRESVDSEFHWHSKLLWNLCQILIISCLKCTVNSEADDPCQANDFGINLFKTLTRSGALICLSLIEKIDPVKWWIRIKNLAEESAIFTWS